MTFPSIDPNKIAFTLGKGFGTEQTAGVGASTGTQETETVQEGQTVMPPVGSPPASSEAAHEGIPKSAILTSEQLQTAYDAIDWKKPDMMQVLQLISSIFAKIKSLNNEAKWGEAQAQCNSLMSEAKNLEEGASKRFWAALGTSLASGVLAGVNLRSTLGNMKQINALTKEAGGIMAMGKDKFDRVSLTIQNLNSQITITKLKTEMADGIVKAGGAIGNYQAELYDADAKKDAAEATLRGANQQDQQSAEANSEEAIKKVAQMMQDLLQLIASAERDIVSRV